MIRTILVPASGSETDAVVLKPRWRQRDRAKPILSSFTSESAPVRR
jgi:hypothetical protein